AGDLAVGTATVHGPAAAGGAMVTLSSGNSAVSSIPSSVTIGPGATSANFIIFTNGAITATATGPITATYNGSATATLTVVPQLKVSSVAFSPATVVGGSPSTGTVTLTSAAPARGGVVSLPSGQPPGAAVP